MGGHGDHRHHHHQEVGVLVDDEDEELEQQQQGRGACGGATSGVVEQGVGNGCQEAAGMVFEASSSVGSVSATMAPSQILCWPPPQQQLHHHHHSIGGGGQHQHQQGSFFPLLPPLPPPQPPPPPPFFADFYARRALQFAYDHSGGGGASSSSDPLGLYMGHHHHHHGGAVGSGMMMPPPFGIGSSPFGDFGRMTAQEIMDAKALAASKSHSEAERRRRERINAHLARLRSLLPNTTKTDKASLLAEVIQHVKELKRQTSEITEDACPLPTESDELTVDASSDEDGRLVVRASLCCDDRADLLPDLIRALKALRLRALKAEITTLGGRVKNVLVVTGDDTAAGCGDGDDEQQEQPPMSPQHTVASIQDALRAVMERTASTSSQAEETGAASSGGGLKRQRTTSLSAILENRSI
ncbi:hypothetical protein EJB05_07268, partial [Eragrostis curvula]